VQNGIRRNNNIAVAVVLVDGLLRDAAWRERAARAQFREGTRRSERTRFPAFPNILLHVSLSPQMVPVILADEHQEELTGTVPRDVLA